MRILLINKYWRKQGGVEEYCFLLKEVLESLGHEVIPFAQREDSTFSNPYVDYFPSEVDPAASGVMERLKGVNRAIYGADARRSLARLLDDFEVDVAHVVHIYHQLGPGLMQELKKRRIPVILSVHDYKLSCPSYRLLDDSTGDICTICLDNPNRKFTAPVTTACWRGSRAAGMVLGAEAVAVRALGTYTYARAVLVSNDLMRRSAISGGVPADRIYTVPNFWPTPLLNRPPRGRAEHVLFVGRLVVEKGVESLIRASADSGVSVKIIGVGPLEAKLKELAEKLSAPVTFLGQMWGPEVERAMLESRGLVVPSIWHEVSPLVIYQAMTLGVPVVGSRVGGIPDLIGSGRGILCEAGDVDGLAEALTRLKQESVEVDLMAERALAYSRQELSRDRFEDRIRDAYAMAGVKL